jgi:hypothetical protein
MQNALEAEVEEWLRHALRGTPLYSRLSELDVRTSDHTACGWVANIAGHFDPDEEAFCSRLIRSLQRRTSPNYRPLNGYTGAELRTGS